MAKVRTLEDLAKSLRIKADAIPEFASSMAKQVARKFLEDVVTLTPVDTSKALSNWIVTLGRPAESEIDAYYEGELGSTYLASGRKAIQNGHIALLKKKPKQSIFITNNVDYIESLNNGSSPQTAGAFVEGSLMAARLTIRKKRN